jgi:ribonuclease HI
VGRILAAPGSANDHTVFEAELAGLLMGLHLIEANKKGNISFSIGADNQAAIKALSSKFDKPGHYLAAEAFRTAERIRKNRGKKYSLTLRWTAGHSGIPGNEEVDKEAKKAAEGKSTDAEELPKLLRKQLKTSKSASIAAAAAERKKRWRREWIASPRYAKFKHFDPTLPSRNFIKLISNTKISRADASKIFQMRSGHAPLNAYLHRFKRKESAQCPACGAPKETPQHFLLECPAYAHERWKLKPKKGAMETRFAELLANEKKIVALAHFMKATRRFALDEQEGATMRQKTDDQNA